MRYMNLIFQTKVTIPKLRLGFKPQVTAWFQSTNNGLVLVSICKGIINSQLLVFNPITKECIELPKLPNSHYSMYVKFNYVCDFFEHDLQSSTYKIFLAWYSSAYIYNSSSQLWQSLDSISNLIPKVSIST